jgi:histidinol-phosphate aminotransferase
MIQPKSHLYNVYRTPPDKLDRLKFLRLDKNEDTIGLPEEVIQEILSEVTPDFISTYPLTYRLYESLSEFLSLSEDHLLITAGSDAAIKAAFEGFVEPGDEVIIPDPTFAMFEVYADLFRGEMKKITYKSDLSLSIEEMLGSITQKTKLIALPNPNSPTGTIVRREDILNLLKHAEAVGVVVLIDEAYYPFYPHTTIDLIDEYQNLIVTRTFSKAFGLASVRTCVNLVF